MSFLPRPDMPVLQMQMQMQMIGVLQFPITKSSSRQLRMLIHESHPLVTKALLVAMPSQ
ncbi:hypothetical protein PS639_03028 [Pseudomonas fluorescens]|nr:hypothetical protein PS639_03028 [Pseudomonas fluorescens]